MSGPADLAGALAVLRRQRARARIDAGVDFIGVVGSLARGDERPESDVDVIVEQVAPTTIFRISRLERALQAEAGRPFDLVFREALSPVRRAYIERDLVAL